MPHRDRQDRLAPSENPRPVHDCAWQPGTDGETSDGTANPVAEDLISRIEAQGLRMTGQRRTIARVLSEASDHPDAEELHARASRLDPRISIATVYRTVKLLEEAGLLEKRDFGDGRARFEDSQRAHHDHLIDMDTGRVIEFCDPEIEALQERIARRLGYRLLGHRLELYGEPLEPKSDPPD